MLKIKTLVFALVVATVFYFWYCKEALQPISSIRSARGKTKPFQLPAKPAAWPNGTFCHDFMEDTFQDPIPMCGREVRRKDQVKCSGSVHSPSMMASCSVQNLALRPQQLREVIATDKKWNPPKSKTVNLLKIHEYSCEYPSADHLRSRTEDNDYELLLTSHILSSPKLKPSVCDVWINKTTFFHVSSGSHIYFRILDLYNLHKFLIDYNVTHGDYNIVRIGNMNSYHMPYFDRMLFPGAQTLDNLPKVDTICFKRVVFVPRGYQSVLFRCKRDPHLRHQCLACDGRRLTNSTFHSFRDRVLNACNIEESIDAEDSRLKVMIVSRNPYKRYAGDKAAKFERILKNEKEMVAKIKEKFNDVLVRVLHMENMNLCEQVRQAVEADVMLGVHGAGLVHFWWLRDEAVGFELEPTFKKDNPAFRVLTSLAGRNYDFLSVVGDTRMVSVNTDRLIRKLQALL